MPLVRNNIYPAKCLSPISITFLDLAALNYQQIWLQFFFSLHSFRVIWLQKNLTSRSAAAAAAPAAVAALASSAVLAALSAARQRRSLETDTNVKFSQAICFCKSVLNIEATIL